MIDFTTVAREFRGLVDRRREVFTFLGTSFAALGLFLQNALQGGLPPSLNAVSTHVFAFYAGVLSLLSLILSLRMAKMHGGIIINGMLFAHLMTQQSFAKKGDVQRASRHNFLGVSFLQFILVNLIAWFSVTILCLSLHLLRVTALSVGGGVFFLWVLWYFRFHRKAVEYAYYRIETDEVEPVQHEEWEDHISLCLQQSTAALLSEVAFAGLMVFSVFEALSGLNQIKEQADLSASDVKEFGPIAFAGLMAVTCFFQLRIYIRTYVAIGGFCLQLDENDKPFRPFRLTDSFLGYLTLSALWAVAIHILAILLLPWLESNVWLHLGIDAAAFMFALGMHQVSLIRHAIKMHK